MTYDVPVGHLKFGVSEPCECTREERHRGRLEALNAISSDVDFEATFNNFDVDRVDCTPEQRKKLREALWWSLVFARWPDWPDDSRLPDVPFLTLAGEYGTGKTHLARAIWNYRQNPASNTTGAAFVVVPDLLDYIRQTFSGYADESYDRRFEGIRRVWGLLILDDLGAESQTDWVDEKLYQIVSWRYNNRLPSVFTTNQPSSALMGRLLDRLTEGKIVRMGPRMPSYRMARAASRQSDAAIAEYGPALEREMVGGKY